MTYFDAPEQVDPPDGTHQVTVVEADAFTGKDGREWAKVVLRLPDGGTFDDFMGLSHPVGRAMARDELSVYGVDTSTIDDVDDLALAMSELAGVEAEVTVSHDNGYVRVKAHAARPAEPKEQVPADRADLDRPPAPATDDDDIPF